MTTNDYKKLKEKREMGDKNAAQLRVMVAEKKKKIEVLQAEIQEIENDLLDYPATTETMGFMERLAAVTKRYGL